MFITLSSLTSDTTISVNTYEIGLVFAWQEGASSIRMKAPRTKRAIRLQHEVEEDLDTIHELIPHMLRLRISSMDEDAPETGEALIAPDQVLSIHGKENCRIHLVCGESLMCASTDDAVQEALRKCKANAPRVKCVVVERHGSKLIPVGVV
jgi:hypothetical protein